MSQPIAVLEKAFLVLETVDKLGRTATLKELTEATGLPKPTLYRILQTLVDLGYVDQDSARSRYGLSLRLRQLARGGDDFEELRQKMLPVMESLHRKFNETINLGVLQLNHVYYVHFIETTQNLRWQVRPSLICPKSSGSNCSTGSSSNNERPVRRQTGRKWSACSPKPRNGAGRMTTRKTILAFIVLACRSLTLTEKSLQA